MESKNKIWTSQGFVLFGSYLLEEGEYGHGLLCIHGPFLGLDITTQLKLKWKHLICSKTLKPYNILDDLAGIKGLQDDDEIIVLNDFFKNVTERVFNIQSSFKKNLLEDFVYTKRVSGKVIETSNLNKELFKFYNQFEARICRLTGFELNFRIPKSNAFEIAWARENVLNYGCLKPAFKAVGKHMGHRTIRDTSKLLELEVHEDDDIVLRYDINAPNSQLERDLIEPFSNKVWITNYILKNWFVIRTDASQLSMDKFFKENPLSKERH